MSHEPSPHSNLRLKVTAGQAAGSELSVEDELVIGREASEEGRLGNDIEISRRHARIGRTDQGEWVIEDLGSRNGTFVNGHRITGQELLAAGDAIEVGGTRLVVQVRVPTTPPTPVVGDTAVGAEVPQPDAEVAEEQEELEPAAEAAEDAVAEPRVALPPVSLRVDLDPAAGAAAISLGDGSDRVEMRYHDGAWRLRPQE